MGISELFKDHGHKLLIIFLILFLGSNYDNGQVMLLYGLFVGYYFFIKNYTGKTTEEFLKDNIFILGWGVIISMITSFITMKIPVTVIAKKRTWIFVYLGVLFLLYLPYIFFNKDKIKSNKFIILLYFLLGLIPIINVMNILTNSYKCNKIKETNITQTFSCEDITISS